MAIGKYLERLGVERGMSSTRGLGQLARDVARRTKPQGDRPELQQGVRKRPGLVTDKRWSR